MPTRLNPKHPGADGPRRKAPVYRYAQDAQDVQDGADALLSRESFGRLVLARAKGRCIFCAAPAVDAHHIIERKLFADGGYRLTNGAAVCALHHWDCETTRIPVERVRSAAGIVVGVAFRNALAMALVHPGEDPLQSYDKWGNKVWPSGLRSWGPLENDTGARKALAVGGFMWLMMPASYSEAAESTPTAKPTPTTN